MGMMQILLIGWIVLCLCCIIMSGIYDTTKDVEDEESRFTGTWCVASSCMCLTLSVMPFLIVAMLSEQGLKGISDMNARGPGGYSPASSPGYYSTPSVPSAPPRI